MFGRKSRKAQTETLPTTATTYSASDYTPHGVSITWGTTGVWSRPQVWQSTRFAAEELARQIRRDHPEWRVEVIRQH